MATRGYQIQVNWILYEGVMAKIVEQVQSTTPHTLVHFKLRIPFDSCVETLDSLKVIWSLYVCS